MHERSLPASPNWYCSRCSDVNSSGLLGVGAKNIIYLIDVSASSCRVVGKSAGVTLVLIPKPIEGYTSCYTRLAQIKVIRPPQV